MQKLIREAVTAAGGPAALAKTLGISTPAVCQMVKRGRVPSKRVLSVEKASGISRSKLRPDLYPPEEHNALTKD